MLIRTNISVNQFTRILLKSGINDGYLTPYRIKRIHTTIDDYTYVPGDVVEQGEIDKSKLYTEKDMHKEIVLPDREKYRSHKIYVWNKPSQRKINGLLCYGGTCQIQETL